MLKVNVYDESNTAEGTVSIEFTFDGYDPVHLEQAAALLRMACSFAPSGSRLSFDLPAHAAYFETLVGGLRRGLPRAHKDAEGST